VYLLYSVSLKDKSVNGGNVSAKQPGARRMNKVIKLATNMKLLKIGKNLTTALTVKIS